ncbi:MAG: 3-hydroxyacyl-CoA dehydrogenase [Candidatus Obscuribacterales bacterium]|nr:3-hydroxyacyl-CoA dehydrogenase [Candidatus Obscuribacterales bacterium]
MQIRQVAIIGAGTMGASISVAVASAGYEVLLRDVSVDALQQGLQKIDKMFQSLVRKGLAEETAQRHRARIKTVTDYSELADADLVIEAVLEKIDVKTAVFRELDRSCKPSCILGTNTSSLSITEIAACTNRPDKVVGLHFFNPAHLMKLVEVVPALQTSQSVCERTLEFARSLNKLAVRVEECASFLVNRLLGRYMGESLWVLQEGVATIEEIDKAVTDYVMPIGPLALRDMNGADIGLAVARFNFQEYGERFRPAPLLEAMVAKNWLGQKTGKGFYLYDPETKKRTVPNGSIAELILPSSTPPAAFNPQRLFLPMINEAFLALQENVCAAEDLDPALMAGLGMRRGPLELAEELGLANCLEQTEKLFASYGERFRPAPLLKRYVRAGRSSILKREGQLAAASN